MKNKFLLFLMVVFSIFLDATELKREGWNLISVCQDMNRTDIDMTGIQQIQSLEGKNIYTGASARFSSLNTLVSGYGYWVKGTIGTAFLSKDGISIPSTYQYPIYNNELKNGTERVIVTATLNEYTLKFFSNEDLSITGQELQKSLIVSINGNETPEIPIASTYKNKTLVVGVYDSTDTLIAVSDILVVEDNDFPLLISMIIDSDVSINTSPVLGSIPNQIITDTTLTLELNATDAENDTITFDANSSDSASVTAEIIGNQLTLTRLTSSGGTFTITVSATDDKGASDIKSFTVTLPTIVMDTENPIVTLNGSAEINVTVGGIYTELNAMVTDNVDTGLTATITGSVDTSKVGKYTLTYTATDSAGNIGTATRIINVTEVPDITVPVITLLGDATVNLLQGAIYTDAGATASDNKDGNITNNIIINNPVDTSIIGVYTVTYNVQDSAGNSALEVTRTVNVIENVHVFNDFEGYLYVANEGNGGGGGTTIFKVDVNGTASLLADGFTGPSGLAVDSGTQTLYISDDRNQVYRLLSDGNVSVLAIDSAYLSNPNALVIDSYGYLLIANAGSGTIVRVDPNNTTDITTIATGFNTPQAVEIYGDMAYFTDFSNNIYEVNVHVTTPVTPSSSLYKDMSSYVFGTQGGLMSDFNGSLFISSYETGEVFKVDSTKNVTTVYSNSESQPRGLLYLNEMLYITLYDQALVVRVNPTTLDSEVFSDNNHSTMPYRGPFGIRYSSVDYPSFDATYLESSGSEENTTCTPITDMYPTFTIAKNNTLADISEIFNGLRVDVTTDTVMSETSTGTIAIYGTIDGNNTEALLKLNGNYPIGSQFIVKVYKDNVLVGISSIVSGSGALNFGDIQTQQQCNTTSISEEMRSTFAGKTFYITYTNENNVGIIEEIVFDGNLTHLTWEEVVGGSERGNDTIRIVGNKLYVGVGEYHEYIEQIDNYLLMHDYKQDSNGNWIQEGVTRLYFNFDDAESYLNTLVPVIMLPDGYTFRAINNLGTEVETTITSNGVVYTLKLYSNFNVTANDQANHVGIFANVNGQSALLQIQNNYETHKVVLAVYDASGTLVAVSDEKTVNGNTSISLTF